jgi:ATP-dependent Clp protease ATP-binding subunit ClpA
MRGVRVKDPQHRIRTDKAKALESAADGEATKRGHTYVGTEHILFAILSNDGLGQTILNALGVSYGDAVAKFEELMRRQPSGRD